MLNILTDNQTKKGKYTIMKKREKKRIKEIKREKIKKYRE